MKKWTFALVAAVLTAMVFVPQIPETRQVSSPEVRPAELVGLRLEKVSPAVLPSRSPIQAYVTAQKPLEGVRVCVDPGHGGQTQWSKLKYTGGTVGVATGQTESDVNLRVSLLLELYLRAAGAEVFMTRRTDDRCTNGEKTEELDFRSQMANSKNCDLFISVHHNEAPSRGTNYTVVFFPPGIPKAVGLADNISASVSRYIGTNNIGGRAGKYRVLNGIKMPGVIVESSFMSCPDEDSRLSSLAYNKLQAKAIATGVMNYVRMEKGRTVDFNTIFAPIDEQAGSAQQMADATFVRKQIVEKRSLFGVRYEEVTYDAAGTVVSSREIGKNGASAERSFGKSSQPSKKDAKAMAASKKSSSSKKGIVITDSKTSSKGAKPKATVAKASTKSTKKSSSTKKG
ncbi:MAG: N-acetylmuramoyl-L-alanine amidase [Candidatus Sumerlaeaceae bacterium]|nr:N-acetylmuramoyl-L-alanine amidase [Candidatus Sumerlaeaceae bacterium]